jgi:hypothetical protein
MMEHHLYGLRSILVRFLGYPMEVVYQSCFDVLMGLSFYAIRVPYLQEFFVGSSVHGCSMKKLGVPFPLLYPSDPRSFVAREFLPLSTSHPIPGSSRSPPFSIPHCSPMKCKFSGAFSFFLLCFSSLGLYSQMCPCSTH